MKKKAAALKHSHLTAKADPSRNATTHGMRQEHFQLLPGESQAEFDSMAKRWRDDYAKWAAHYPAVEQLLTDLIEQNWLSLRCRRNLNKWQIALDQAQADENLEREQLLEKRIQNALRYKTATENAFQRAFKALEQFRHTRVKEHQAWKRLDILEFNVVDQSARAHFNLGTPDDLPEPELPSTFTQGQLNERNYAAERDLYQTPSEHPGTEKEQTQGGQESKG